ncbi:MAG TPA: hypothetical protein VHJ18_31100 [Streptosporangiaceae bacterium]|nr:hypothetical protein [Streptosporangiaceae bacterium]
MEIGRPGCLMLASTSTTGVKMPYIRSAVSSADTLLPGTGWPSRRDKAASTVLLSRFIQVIVRTTSSMSACS